MAAEQVNRGGAAAPPRPSGIARAAGLLVSGLEVYCGILMVGMAVIVLTGVWYRYIPQRALSWYDEFAEFLLVWLTFYGSVLAAHRGAHIGFETLTDALPERLRRIVVVLSELIVLFIQAALFYYGLSLVRAASFDTAVSIYQWNSASTTQQLVLTAYWRGVDSVTWNDGVMLISVRVSMRPSTMDRPIGKMIDTTSYPPANPDSVGKMIARAYGDFTVTPLASLGTQMAPVVFGYGGRYVPGIVVREDLG